MSVPVHLRGTNDGEGELNGDEVFKVGDRTDKFCAKCNEERGHIVTSVSKRGQISRVSCSKCETISTFQIASRTLPRPSTKTPSPYDRTLTYRAGQSMTHEMFGVGVDFLHRRAAAPGDALAPAAVDDLMTPFAPGPSWS